jgi:hypothetical protein
VQVLRLPLRGAGELVAHGYALRRIGSPIRPHVLHLVRDSRAVAYSWQRRKFNPGSGEDMNRYSLLRTAAEWNAINALTALHRRTGTPYSILRYSDFAEQPARAVAAVLDSIGEGGRPAPVTERGTVTLGENHTVAGNPNRFRRGELEIRPDEEWRQQMSTPAKGLVTALTLPGLARRGRSPHRPGAERLPQCESSQSSTSSTRGRESSQGR